MKDLLIIGAGSVGCHVATNFASYGLPRTAATSGRWHGEIPVSASELPPMKINPKELV